MTNLWSLKWKKCNKCSSKFPRTRNKTFKFFCPTKSLFVYRHKWQKAANPHIQEAVTSKCLTIWLQKQLKRFIDYPNSRRLICLWLMNCFVFATTWTVSLTYIWKFTCDTWVLSLSSRKMCDDLITSNTRRKVTLKNPQIKTVTFHSILKSRRWSRAAVFTVLCCVSVTGVFVLPRGGRKFTVLTVFQSVLPWHVPHHLMLRDRLTLWDFLLNMYEYETIFI